LPPTPNNNACQCLESHLSCTFRPSIANYSIVVGPLLDTACGLLEQRSGSCADIGGNGTTGVYGRVSACDSSQSNSLYTEWSAMTDLPFQPSNCHSCSASTTSLTIAIRQRAHSLATAP
jgi:hypothetical protein